MIATAPRMFRDRADAGRRLADRLRGRQLRDPLVLAIPRGGVAVGAVVADELGAELDVVLARKLRHPAMPEVAIGAAAERGWVLLDSEFRDSCGRPAAGVTQELHHQLAQIERWRHLVRRVRRKAPVAGRSVIVVDDGLATGSTMIAALRTARAERPDELIAALPVAAPGRLVEVRRWCDDAVCLAVPRDFRAVGQFYENFEPVGDEDVLRLFRDAHPAAQPAGAAQGMP